MHLHSFEGETKRYILIRQGATPVITLSNKQSEPDKHHLIKTTTGSTTAAAAVPSKESLPGSTWVITIYGLV